MAAKPEIDPQVFATKAYADNPYPTLKLLRDHYPAYCNPLNGSWMVTRYEDVVATFKDTENFSASPNGESIGAVFGPTLMEYDGAYTSPDRLQRAKRAHRLTTLVLVAAALACVHAFWP